MRDLAINVLSKAHNCCLNHSLYGIFVMGFAHYYRPSIHEFCLSSSNKHFDASEINLAVIFISKLIFSTTCQNDPTPQIFNKILTVVWIRILKLKFFRPPIAQVLVKYSNNNTLSIYDSLAALKQCDRLENREFLNAAIESKIQWNIAQNEGSGYKCAF